MKEFFLTLAQTVAIEIIGVFGIFFVFGYILSRLQEKTHNHYRRTIGWKGILFTGWLGTPIHECAHLLFAKLFRHRIDSVSFFSPNKQTGGLGYVNHSYRKTSLYQSIGNFFIGAAPLLLGPLVLILMLFFLVPNGHHIVSLLINMEPGLSSIVTNMIQIGTQLFQPSNMSDPRFWLFVYLSFCVVAHLAPSKQDRKAMWQGFAWLIALLAILNSIPLLIGLDPTSLVTNVFSSLHMYISIFVYAISMSVLHYLLSFALLLLPFRARKS
jgi:hypothetical protein